MDTAQMDAVLRTLDAAAGPLSVAQRDRAGATLERIVATTPSTPARRPVALPPARRSRRRLLLAPAAALALVVGSLLVQGGGGGDRAYASWTPTPAAVSRPDLDAATAACRDDLEGDDTIDGDRARLVLAERRGDFVALVHRTEDPDLTAACLVHNPPGSTDVDDVNFGVGGSTGPALTAPETGFTQGAVFEYDDGASSITDGAVGGGVTGVTIHAGDLTVQATVQNGRYVAWWPGPAFQSDAGRGGGGDGDLRLSLTYDLTLADGTVVRDAQPLLPS